MDTRIVNLVQPSTPGAGTPPGTSPRSGGPTAAQQSLLAITPVSSE